MIDYRPLTKAERRCQDCGAIYVIARAHDCQPRTAPAAHTCKPQPKPRPGLRELVRRYLHLMACVIPTYGRACVRNVNIAQSQRGAGITETTSSAFLLLCFPRVCLLGSPDVREIRTDEDDPKPSFFATPVPDMHNGARCISEHNWQAH